MDGWQKLTTPGLILSACMHAVGAYLLVSALVGHRPIAVDEWNQATKPAASQSVVEKADSQLRTEGHGDILQSSLMWWALACWCLSLCSLTPSLIGRLYQRQSQSNYQQNSYGRQPQPDSHPLMSYESSQYGDTSGTVTASGLQSSPSLLGRIKGELVELRSHLEHQPIAVGEGFYLRSYRDNLNHLESQAKLMYNSMIGTNDAVQKTVSRIQRLFRQCRDSANFSAANRLDWKRTTMLGNLSQVRQSHDRVLDTSKNIAAIHASTLRLLTESIHGEDIFYQKIDRVQTYLSQVQDSSHAGYKSHDQVTAIIGESRDGVANAAKLVNGLTQKAETLLSIIGQLDDIAEKINCQTLQVSVQLSKAKSDLEPQIASELRSEAARFHTCSRSVKDLAESIHAEIDTSLHHLTDAGSRAEQAFASVNQCGELYRNNVSATKYGLSELALLRKEVAIHMKKLAETKDLGDSTDGLMNELDRLLSGYNEMNKRISEETNQMAAHCDKLSHLLSKQYYELSHCEKMLTDSSGVLKEATQYATENKQNVLSLKVALEELSKREMQGETTDEGRERVQVIAHLIQLIDQHLAVNPMGEKNREGALVPVMSMRHG